MMSNHYRNSACSVRHVMLGVDDDGHRPVIDQSDPYMRAETTFLHRHSPGAQRLVELDPHEIGMLGLAGLDEARAIALVHVGEQRELRDGENLTADVLNRTVHLALRILEHPEIQNLMGQPGDLLVAVLIGDAHQNHESRANLLRLERGIQRAQFIDHVHGRFGYSLQYDFHGSLQYNVCSPQPVTYTTDW